MSCFTDDDAPCGIRIESTPRPIHNRPGLKALSRRIGTQGRFKQAMLEQLARSPALAALAARDDADATVALIDAWAAALDVITFYQERINDEAYLGTAQERRSVLELARAIGYELQPGVAAGTLLACTLEAAPGLQEPVLLAPGLKVQSTPGPGELPQTFETVEALGGRIALNAMPARTRRPQAFNRRSTRAWLAGTGLHLQPGDVLLFVGPRRLAFAGSESWDARRLQAVTEHAAAGITEVQWTDALGHSAPEMNPEAQPEVFVFRRRAALFGHNAPDVRGMPEPTRTGFGVPAGATEWPGFEITTTGEQRIDLDAPYADLLEGSWLRLEKASYEELYRVVRVRSGARTDFTLTAKTTQVFVDTREHLSWFGLRETVVHAASQPLVLAEAPVPDAVWGDRIELQAPVDGLLPGRKLLLRGRPLHQVQVAPRQWSSRSGSTRTLQTLRPLVLVATTGSAAGSRRTLIDGQVLAVAGTPQPLPDGRARWPLVDEADGFAGSLDVAADELLPLEDPPPEGFTPPDPLALAAEAAELLRTETTADGATVLVLRAPMAGVYQRGSFVVHANVVAATHGATVVVPGSVALGAAGAEPLGSGQHALPMQAFALQHKPVTHVSDPTAPGGARSTVAVRVDGVLWQPVPTLHGQPPDARVYSLRHADDGTAVVQFGDGEHGARLPTGRDNVTASYRVGTGLAGQVRAGQLTLLMSRPLGLKAAINPLPATGAQDPEALDGARANAPLTVLTLERVVSVQDAEDFARTYAGIGKARAAVLWNGERRMIHLSLAAADGTPLDAAGTTAQALRSALDAARPADQRIAVGGYELRRFALDAAVQVAPDHLAATVLAACRAALLAAFGFAQRPFAQGTHVAELAALLHAVPGVVGVAIRRLDGRNPLAAPRLDALPARWNAAGAAVLPAQLLLIDEAALDLTALQPTETP